MPSKLGLYCEFAHMRETDIRAVTECDMAVLCVPNTGERHLEIAAANPRTVVLFRDHALSEQYDDYFRDPTGTGKRHAEEIYAKARSAWEGLGRQGRARPPWKSIKLLGLNEVSIHWRGTVDEERHFVLYEMAFLSRLSELGGIGGALRLSVGWPRNTGPDTPATWESFETLLPVIRQGGHAVVLHEYGNEEMTPESSPGWPWHYGRWSFLPDHWAGVDLVIGETGINGAVGRPPNHPHRGWKDYMTAGQYMDLLIRLDRRYRRLAVQKGIHFLGAAVFIADGSGWASFDLEPIYPLWKTYAEQERHVEESEIFVPYLPGGPQPVEPPVIPRPQPAADQAGLLFWPVLGVITQHWMQNPQDYRQYNIPGHNGLDIAAPLGTPVQAAGAGVVVWVGEDTDYGRYVRIWHPQWRLHTFYAHLQDIHVHQGQTVAVGQTIGTVGNTGRSTGAHLHFEVRLGLGEHQYELVANGQGKGRIDPFPLLVRGGA